MNVTKIIQDYERAKRKKDFWVSVSLLCAVLLLAGCSQAELKTAEGNASAIAGGAAKGAASAAEANALSQIDTTGKINTKQLETAAGAGAVQGAIGAIPATTGT